MNEKPEWFGKALAMAMHEDAIASWPWYQRLLHKWFIPCPCCKAIKERNAYKMKL